MIVTQMIFVLNDRLREASMLLNESMRAQEVTRFHQFSISQILFLTSDFVSFVAPLFELWVMHWLQAGEEGPWLDMWFLSLLPRMSLPDAELRA